jgi:hypothetical protein
MFYVQKRYGMMYRTFVTTTSLREAMEAYEYSIRNEPWCEWQVVKVENGEGYVTHSHKPTK